MYSRWYCFKGRRRKRVVVTVLGYVALYYIYHVLQVIGSHDLPFGVCALLVYDACVCTALVPSE